MNTWPGGKRHAMDQSEHEMWNRNHYPGTRQLCSECEQPTGNCEEDTWWSVSGEPLCRDCWIIENEYDCPIHGKLGGIDECPRC